MTIASLSLDLDNKWAYLRAAGRDDWEQASSYFSLAVDRITRILGECDLPLTVFLVGRDLNNQVDVESIQRFERLNRWEAANHSLNHLPWMHTMAAEEILLEIQETHRRIVDNIGQTPLGFRGPGFSCPPEVLQVLQELGYVYDASVFPTSMAPIARWVFLARTDLKGEQREKAKKLYGGFSSMLHPNRPYQRQSTIVNKGDKPSTRGLWEIPVTVMPLTRTPIHFSYVTFLASHSVMAAKAYFRSALLACKWMGVSPSLLLHPPDFLGQEDDADMAYFPGMKMPAERKLSLMRWALGLFAEMFDVKTMAEQVASLDPSFTWPHSQLDVSANTDRFKSDSTSDPVMSSHA